MATNMPAALDIFTNPPGTVPLGLSGPKHSLQHADLNDAVASAARIVVGPTHYNVVGHFGGDNTGATETSGAINTGLAANKGIIHWPPGLYKLANPILPQSNQSHKAPWSGLLPGGGFQNGAQLQWIGAPGGTVVKAMDCQNLSWEGLSVDGAGIQSVTALLIDSDNAPNTQMVDIGHFWIERCGNGSGPSAYGIRVGQSIVNNYQVDRVQLHDGYIYVVDTGLSVESDNACDASTFRNITFSLTNIGTQILACGELQMDSLIYGGMYGADPAYMSLGARAVAASRYNPLIIRSCQGEGFITTVAAGSNGVDVSTFTGAGVLNVTTTAGSGLFSGSTVLVETANGYALVSYTGKSANTYTGCAVVTGAAGTGVTAGAMATGGTVADGYGMRIVGSGDTAHPVTMIGNSWAMPCQLEATKRLTSIGNFYSNSFWLPGVASYVYALADAFAAGASFKTQTAAGSKVGMPLWVQGENGGGTPAMISAVRSGAPTIVGNVGDICIRLDTGQLYRCTVSGLAGSATWTTP